MKMNDTVARIVELMFQDVEMNEETSAIRDEVMDNCQERYNDLVASGMDEDEAISAVVESLSGMEDVLRPYKRRKRHAPVRVYERGRIKVEVHEDGDPDEEDDDDDEDEDLDDFDDDEDDDEDLEDFDEDEDLDEDDEDPERFVTFPASEISRIELHLTAEDVTLERSADGDYHILWNDEDSPHIGVSACEGKLLIGHQVEEEADECDREKEQSARDAENRLKDSMKDFVRTQNGRLELDFSTLNGVLRSLNSSIRSAIKNGSSFSFGDGEVTIQVPEHAIPHTHLCTTSGDIRIDNVTMADLSVTTTSGDVEIDQNEDQHMQTAHIVTTSGAVDDVTLYADEVNIRTTSGDVDDANIHADSVAIGTTSGDVEDVNIHAREVHVTTVSGDVEADIHADNASVRTTSGDAEVDGRMQTLTVSTVSGDVEVNADMETLTFRTVSGDVDLSCGEQIRSITGNTVSGDVEVDLPDNIGAIATTVTSRAGEVRVNHPTVDGGPTVSGRISSNCGDITIE